MENTTYKSNKQLQVDHWKINNRYTDEISNVIENVVSNCFASKREARLYIAGYDMEY